MDNKKLGIILVIASVLLGGIVFVFDRQLSIQSAASCSCAGMQGSGAGFCPMDEKTPWQTYAAVTLISGVAALGIYLLFFEKSQRAIISTLEKQKQLQTQEEKFSILLMGLDNDEQKVINAVREQEGITQQTLRLRTDLHKSKLSIVLASLEKKGLIKREDKGKTKQVFLKISL